MTLYLEIGVQFENYLSDSWCVDKVAESDEAWFFCFLISAIQ